MKIDKQEIWEWTKVVLVLGVIALFLGLFLWAIISMGIQDKRELKRCLEYYGEEYSWKKRNLDYDIDSKGFNKTHFACCKKVDFIDSNGQIQNSKCEVLLERRLTLPNETLK